MSAFPSDFIMTPDVIRSTLHPNTDRILGPTLTSKPASGPVARTTSDFFRLNQIDGMQWRAV